MFTQLNPPLPLFIASKNIADLAHAVIDYGPEHHLLWVCFLNESGECIVATLQNTLIMRSSQAFQCHETLADTRLRNHRFT